MILLRLQGGLGNQMFQYAFGKYLAVKNNTILKLDDTLLKDRSLPDEVATHRDFELNVFNTTSAQHATQKEIWNFNGSPSGTITDKIRFKIHRAIKKPHLLIQERNEFKEEYINAPDNTCVVGRWQSEKFFKPIENSIKKEFTLREKPSEETEQLAQEIRGRNALCIHYRRKDLITSPVYSKTIGALSNEYYHKAFEKMREINKPEHIYIFSDDISWCKNNLSFDQPHSFVSDALSGNKNTGHLYLMSQCSSFIISNSTFAWWAAWLGNSDKKQVVAPANWYADQTLNNKFITPESWIKI